MAKHIHYGKGNGYGGHLCGLGAAGIAVICARGFGACHEDAGGGVYQCAGSGGPSSYMCFPLHVVVHVTMLVLVMHDSRIYLIRSPNQ